MLICFAPLTPDFEQEEKKKRQRQLFLAMLSESDVCKVQQEWWGEGNYFELGFKNALSWSRKEWRKLMRWDKILTETQILKSYKKEDSKLKFKGAAIVILLGISIYLYFWTSSYLDPLITNESIFYCLYLIKAKHLDYDYLSVTHYRMLYLNIFKKEITQLYWLNYIFPLKVKVIFIPILCIGGR